MDHQNPFPFVLSRQFPHAPEAVFAAWTNPQALAAWWGPASHQTLVQQLDLRPGGFFHYCHQGADGSQLWGRFEYLDIAAPERLAFINAFSDEHHHPGARSLRHALAYRNVQCPQLKRRGKWPMPDDPTSPGSSRYGRGGSQLYGHAGLYGAEFWTNF